MPDTERPMAEHGSVPVPDPTKLTTDAVNAATRQWRMDLKVQRELLDIRIDDMKSLLDERYATQTKALDAAFVAAEKAVATALSSAEKAVAKAETANERRFDSVNEFREQLNDQASTFVTKAEYQVQRDANLARINAVEKSLTNREGVSTGAHSVIGYIVGGAGAFIAAIAIVITIVLTHH